MRCQCPQCGKRGECPDQGTIRVFHAEYGQLRLCFHCYSWQWVRPELRSLDHNFPVTPKKKVPE